MKNRRLLTVAILVSTIAVLGFNAVGVGPAAAALETTAATHSTRCNVAGLTFMEEPALYAALPASVRSSGTFSVGTDPTAPPYDFVNSSGRVIGLEVELADALGCVMGLKTHVSTIAFESLLSAIPAGRYDAGMATISDTVAREKVMSFVDYQTEGTAIIVARGNPDHLGTIQSLCGLRVAGQTGSIPLELLQLENKQCHKKMTILTLVNESQGYLAVASGRVVAYMDTYGTAEYTQKNIQTGLGLETLSKRLYAVGYQSIALGKSASEAVLTKVIAEAVSHLMHDGFYGKLYAKWHLTADELPAPAINNAAKYANYLNLG